MISVEEFRANALAFLEDNAKRKSEESFTWGQGSDRMALLEDKTPEEEEAEVVEGKKWRALAFDAGFEWITGPPRYGGQGLTPEHERVYRELEAQYEVGPSGPFIVSLGIVAPTLLAHAIEDVKQRYLRALWRGDVIACQLFSEPGAGSDLAGLQTRAEQDGDEWVITGQKVWTSGAQFSDVGEIIARTSPDKPKHKGLTAFLVDMGAPGVETRPLRQMTGGAHFNEVFLDEVRVPDTHRLGDVDAGWGVAITTLMNERASIGGDGEALGNKIYERLLDAVRHSDRSADPVTRQRLMDLYVRTSAAGFNTLRARAKIAAGQMPGPEMSIGKLAFTQNLQLALALATDGLGPRMAADQGEWGTYAWAEFVAGVPGIRIAGGTDEIMRNIVGERVLGLPKEPRVTS